MPLVRKFNRNSFICKKTDALYISCAGKLSTSQRFMGIGNACGCRRRNHTRMDVKFIALGL